MLDVLVARVVLAVMLDMFAVVVLMLAGGVGGDGGCGADGCGGDDV